MQMAGGRAPERVMNHFSPCSGDGHGAFTFTCEMPDGARAGWFLYTCVDCGAVTWRNTRGERE